MVRCKITKCVTTLALLFIVPMYLFSPSVDESDNNINVVTQVVKHQDCFTDPKESVRKELISDVAEYISERYEDCNANLAKSIVDHGLSNDIDICFMLAQAEIETCYGKGGIGRPQSKRSIFGVVSRRYKNYDDCVKDYCSILKKSYLINGRTEHHLMTNYITPDGYRYCSKKGYEKTLKSCYSYICQSTEINDLQRQIKKM